METVKLSDLLSGVPYTTKSQYEREIEAVTKKPSYEDDKIVVYRDELGIMLLDKRCLSKISLMPSP